MTTTIRRVSRTRVSYQIQQDYLDYQHRLGISALGLDTQNGGILYSGGRDGVVNAWDVHLPPAVSWECVQDASRTRQPSHQSERSEIDSGPVQMSRPIAPSPSPTTHRLSYQQHTDWVNDLLVINDGKNIVTASSDRTIQLWSTAVPQGYGTSHASLAPTPIGAHQDYVKTIVHAKIPNVLISGGLDRQISVWDLGEGRRVAKSMWGVPLASEAATLNMVDQNATSVYALATTPSGNLIASGYPNGTIRLWDPRTGKKVGKLVGHSDTVRSLLCSQDGRWILSASSDQTVKLWSLAGGLSNVAQPISPIVHSSGSWGVRTSSKCIVTYTNFTDSVWSLYSNDANLDVFWTGSRDGWVHKVWRQRTEGTVSSVGTPVVGSYGSGFQDLTEYAESVGDVVAVCKEDAAVSRLVALDNAYIWTARPSSSSINRWKDVPLKPYYQASVGLGLGADLPNDTPKEVISIPSASIIRPRRHGSLLRRDNDSRSVGWVPDRSSFAMTDAQLDEASDWNFGLDEDDNSVDETMEPVFLSPDFVIQGKPGIIKHCLLNNRRHLLTLDSDGTCSKWDVIRCIKLYDLTNSNPTPDPKAREVAFDALCEQENQSGEWAGHWCNVDIKSGSVTVHLEENRCYDAEAYWSDLVHPGTAVDAEKDEVRVNLGKWLLAHLFQNFRHACMFPGAPLPVQPAKKELSASPNGSTLSGIEVQHAMPMGPSPVAPPLDIAKDALADQLNSVVIQPRTSSHPSPTNKTIELSNSPPKTVPPPVNGGNPSDTHYRDNPPLSLPPDVPIIVSVEESADASSFLDLYRGTVYTLGLKAEVGRLKTVIPTWIYELVVDNKASVKEPFKLGFTLNAEPGCGLGELPGGYVSCWRG